MDHDHIDFPGTDFWERARTFEPRSERDVRFVVVHITGGSAHHGGPTGNHSRSSAASTHYVVNREGSITQMVREKDIANHIDNLHSVSNAHSIGIEHVTAWNGAHHLAPTLAQYAASSRLVAWLCKSHSIPAEHRPQHGSPGIRGHQEEQPQTGRGCPGPGWNWGTYMGRVRLAMGSQATFEDTIMSLARDPFGQRVDDRDVDPFDPV